MPFSTSISFVAIYSSGYSVLSGVKKLYLSSLWLFKSFDRGTFNAGSYARIESAPGLSF